MKSTLKKSARCLAAAGAMLLSAWTAGAANAAPLKCPTEVSATERLLAINAVSNLMGRYSHDLTIFGLSVFPELFALKTPGVSWKVPLGLEGPELVKFFEGFKAMPRTTQPGSLHMHTMFSPVIEIAADGKTAMGTWDAFGPDIASPEKTFWLQNKYGVDFIKEDGEWKIWRLQLFPMFYTPYERSVTDTAKAGDIKAEMDTAGMKGWTGPKAPLWIYDGKTPARGPRTPRPYCTYSPEISATQYAN